MKADLKAFRDDVEESLRKVLDDPRHAPWLAEYVIDKLCIHLGGTRIPRLSHVADQDRHIFELITKQRLTFAQVAERTGKHRTTVYRAYKRERDRRRRFPNAA